MLLKQHLFIGKQKTNFLPHIIHKEYNIETRRKENSDFKDFRKAHEVISLREEGTELSRRQLVVELLIRQEMWDLSWPLGLGWSPGEGLVPTSISCLRVPHGTEWFGQLQSRWVKSWMTLEAKREHKGRKDW